MEQVDLEDVQGLAVYGYNLPLLHFLFFRIDSPEGGRAWLEALIPEITTAGTGAKQPHSLNVGFTRTGLEALGLSAQDVGLFDAEFRDGIESRAEVLGDSGTSHPTNWNGGLGTPALHGVLMLFDDNREELKERRDHHADLMAAAAGVFCLSEQAGAALEPVAEKREHFGFRDGISRVTLKGTGVPRPGSPEVNAGEFVLGHPDEAGLLAGGNHPFARNGTFLVYRKLYQDVAAWRRCLTGGAQSLGISEEQLAAKIMGRWRSGAPVVLTPERDDPGLAADDRASDYLYAGDKDGFKCPFGAHVRRANPRDDFGGMDTRRLLMRRGLPYGAPMPEGVTVDDGVDRGIVGVFVNASISRQFEHVQQVWLNDPKLRGRTTNDKDVIAGDHDGTFDFTMQDPLFARQLPRLPRVTHVKGGAYLFAPSVTSLRLLAGVTNRATLPKEVPAMIEQSPTSPPSPEAAAPVSPPEAEAAAAPLVVPAAAAPPAAAPGTHAIAPPAFLTSIARIKEGSLDNLKMILGMVGSQPGGGPLERIGTVHFARWAIIDGGTRLLFASVFDGNLEKYLDDFVREAARELDAVWGNCEGYPAGGAKDVVALKKFVADTRIENAVEYSACPDAWLSEIKSAVRARRKFKEFLLEFRS